ncbi:MAG: LysM peptidoglycan-binding domain-containing protein [Lachnospiraceae bacterium]
MENRLQDTLSYSEYRIERNRARRLRSFRRQCILAIVTVVLVLVLTISYHAIVSKATASDEKVSYKYYTSIEIAYGDSLWSIAETYAGEEYASAQRYIDEVKEINHMSDDNITAGQYLIVPYYSAEFK